MKIIVLAPGNVISGGPELAHQMCAQIKHNGIETYMYYCFTNVIGPGNAECVEKFKKYGTQHILTHAEADMEGNVIIVPEGLADHIFEFERARIVLWWMSVDNYYRDNKNKDIVELDKKTEIHLVQSEYAKSHLLKMGIFPDKIMEVSDYIDEQYGQFILPAIYRKNIALYNPKKGLDRIIPLIEKTQYLDWRPLIDLSQEEMIMLMQMAKVYVDFGNHPGKDRIPREAALCGCCVITNREGSAAYSEDVCIPEKYKFENVSDEYEDITKLLDYVFENYEDSFKDFNEYRIKINGEKIKFVNDVKLFLERLNK